MTSTSGKRELSMLRNNRVRSWALPLAGPFAYLSGIIPQGSSLASYGLAQSGQIHTKLAATSP